MKFPDCLPKPLGPFYPLPAANVVLLLSRGGHVLFLSQGQKLSQALVMLSLTPPLKYLLSFLHGKTPFLLPTSQLCCILWKDVRMHSPDWRIRIIIHPAVESTVST